MLGQLRVVDVDAVHKMFIYEELPCGAQPQDHRFCNVPLLLRGANDPLRVDDLLHERPVTSNGGVKVDVILEKLSLAQLGPLRRWQPNVLP